MHIISTLFKMIFFSPFRLKLKEVSLSLSKIDLCVFIVWLCMKSLKNLFFNNIVILIK